jgi:hypothetical protein
MMSTWFERARAALLAVAAGAVLVGTPSRAGAADPSIVTACAGSMTGTTFTLSADCDTTVELTVPDGVTVDGAGHFITAHDPPGGNFIGAVVTNAGPSMAIANATIAGTGFAVACTGQPLTGIFFDDAGGAVNDVRVLNITQHSGCPLGLGIRANALAGTARSVTIARTTVTGYQKGGLVASGSMTMNVSDSTIGPSDPLPGLPQQNAVQYGVGGAGGTVTGSTIFGSGYPPAPGATAFLLFDAVDVTLEHNTITGAHSDEGVVVAAGTTGTVLSYNHIERTSPDSPDPLGIGVEVEPGLSAALLCNTFLGWNTDVVGAEPLPCVTTAALPDASEGTSYSASLTAVDGTAPYTWALASGSLPPGLTLTDSGTITGHPEAAGRFDFTVTVTDSDARTSTRSLTITVRAAPTPSTTEPTNPDTTTTNPHTTTTGSGTTPTTARAVPDAPPSSGPTLPVTGSPLGTLSTTGAVLVVAGVLMRIRRGERSRSYPVSRRIERRTGR